MRYDFLDSEVLARGDHVSPCDDAGRPFTVRLADAVRQVAPSWVEAVAVTKAVCRHLARSEMPPAIGDVRLHASGHVSFPPGGIADEDVAILALARLLSRLTGDQCCPFEVWAAIERAQVAPMTFRTARGFGAALQSVPDERTNAYLAAYVRELTQRPTAASTVAIPGHAPHWSSVLAGAVAARLPGWPRAQRRHRSA